ncbi:MAG: TDP-N-acetylfucosamine:lipid II N-acetylfucosaminyltransferase, partial [Bacteroidota bacterium]|nr:TDP-N-acetylfucosamine:lipid II N-acetylfucosaminyltransferase [Bacteroidota bacterium]
LMKQYCKGFSAQPFMYRGGPGFPPEKKYRYLEQYGNVLIGNSLTYENNHLDIFDKLRGINREKRQQLIVPINYGNAYGGKDKFIKLSNIENTLFITDFMPQKDYFLLLGSVSHAIYGNIRQQAMGNIFWCLRNGIKVYLYKDSVIYKQLKEFGYKVFTIEEELSETSLKETLSEQDAVHNCDTFFNNLKNKDNAEDEFHRILKKRNT